MEKVVKRIAECRACGSRELKFLLNLGKQFVSDFVGATEIRAGVECPIELCLCDRCSLVQQRYTAPQDFMYTKHYWYRSGTTDRMYHALGEVVSAALARVEIRRGDIALDIGSNDGTLLRWYNSIPLGIRPRTVGVEPAKNMAEEGREGVDIFVNSFWSAEAYFDAVFQQKAKIVTACGMFYDLNDPNQFIGDVKKVLSDDGIFVAQLMCLRQMLNLKDVGNLAHEHLEFYSLSSLDYLFTKHGLKVVDVEENDVNGGSYRLFVRHVSHPDSATERASKFYESEAGYTNIRVFRDWMIDLERSRSEVRDFLRRSKVEGKQTWVYGASTKGNVILQWYNLDSDLITAAVDKSPEKVGKYTIGTGIPIKSEAEFRAATPDQVLVLPYAFINEFVEREKSQEWRTRGGKFLVPLPELRVV